MTFWECYNSKLRFRGDWFVEGRYWKKIDDQTMLTGYEDLPYSMPLGEKDFRELLDLGVLSLDGWELHPDDQRIYEFNKHLENL